MEVNGKLLLLVVRRMSELQLRWTLGGGGGGQGEYVANGVWCRLRLRVLIRG